MSGLPGVFDDSYMTFILIIIIYGFIALLGLASYIIQGVGILKISASHGKQNGWLGFIPIAVRYQLGVVSGGLIFGKKRMKNPGVWMVVVPIITNIVFYVVYFGMIMFVIYGSATSTLSSASAEGLVLGLIITMIFAFLFLFAGSAIYSIIHLMSLYKIFTAHYPGSRSVYYILLSMFVPFASGILLIKTAGTPIINPPEYMLRAPYGPPPFGSSPYGPPTYGPPTYGPPRYGPPTNGPPPYASGPYPQYLQYPQYPPQQYSPTYPPHPPSPPQQPPAPHDTDDLDKS